MNIRAQQNPAESVADWTDSAELQRQFYMAADDIMRMASDVAKAKHIVEYDGDRRKRALARAMAAPLAGGNSAAAAEAEARASEPYELEMKQLGKEFVAAQSVILQHDALKLKWETSRSLMAMLREATRQL